jgi:hypothetical protein
MVPRIATAQNCPIEIWVFDKIIRCNNDMQLPNALGIIYADRDCHTVKAKNSGMAGDVDLLPGNYCATCTDDGSVLFLDSGCADHTHTTLEPTTGGSRVPVDPTTHQQATSPKALVLVPTTKMAKTTLTIAPTALLSSDTNTVLSSPLPALVPVAIPSPTLEASERATSIAVMCLLPISMEVDKGSLSLWELVTKEHLTNLAERVGLSITILEFTFVDMNQSISNNTIGTRWKLQQRTVHLEFEITMRYLLVRNRKSSITCRYCD